MSLAFKLVIALAILSLISTGVVILVKSGIDRERARIERENANAGRNANDRRAEFARCIDSRGVYDFETGVCSGTD